MIAEAVREHGADLGIALDGDADRVIFVDEFGNEVDGDHIMAICARGPAAEQKLAKKTLVATVMSNMGLDIALRQAGGKVVKTAVGDRYVVEEMLRGGYNLGGEQSGHMIFLDHNTTGDGMITALQVLAIMQRSGQSLSELAQVMVALPQVLVNVRVAEAARADRGARGAEGDRRRREAARRQRPGADPLLRHRAAAADHDRGAGQAADHRVGP